jgi:hypothetical protein
MIENNVDLPQEPKVNRRNKPSRLLKELGIATACFIPIMAFSGLKGYFDSKGTPMIQSTGVNGTLYAATGAVAVLYMGDRIPFKFDNMDPGCLTSIFTIPVTIFLSNICYSLGHAYGMRG